MMRQDSPHAVRLGDALLDYARYLERQGVRQWALSPQAIQGLAKICEATKSESRVPPAKERSATSDDAKKAIARPSAQAAPPDLTVSRSDSAIEAAAEPPLQTEPPGLSAGERLAHLRERTLVCQKCHHLVRTRTQVVFGVGDAESDLMFVGEAPGADEDAQGEPFVGRAGQLLTKIIETMGFSRSSVYIANVLKCRPDMPPGTFGNRPPTGEEMRTCLPYLLAQIEIIRPKVIVALGSTAVRGLLPRVDTPIGRLRGKFTDFRGVPLMPTFHPSYVLREGDNATKRKVWEDMLMVMEKLTLPISEKQRGFFLQKN